MIAKKDLPTLLWKDGELHLLDQRYLPQKVEYRVCRSHTDVTKSIFEMTVRGAPAIGISAAFGMAIAASVAVKNGAGLARLNDEMKLADLNLRCSRPTAVNLAWALDRVMKWLREHQDASPEDIVRGLEREALKIYAEDLESNFEIGRNGEPLVPRKATILTHCNAGALATGGYGTALGVIRAAFNAGKSIHVYVDETRPLLQGARITAFELAHESIPATLITDSCAGYLMSLGKIDLIVVGADRIAINGDTANKIGTYPLAVLAKHHGIPFYIAAPLSTVDPAINSGSEIIIEERAKDEITHLHGSSMAPEGFDAFNPAFDITPADLITAIITDCGVIAKPDRHKLEQLF